MPVTLDPTVGGVNANAYADVAFADSYFNERMHAAAWTSVVDTDTKNRALISATRRIDLLRFRGYRTSDAQALSWPRQYVPKRDTNAPHPIDVNYGTYYWPKDEIPLGVRWAMCETGLWLLTRAADPATPDPLANFSSINVPGALSVTLTGKTDRVAPDALPDAALRLLAEFRDPDIIRVVRT